ncbi:MAG: hypothetical protein QOJ01_668 [Solirubrobacterales bacterium]|nr:hypothetical protein [Solirubrobacterales bacterium]
MRGNSAGAGKRWRLAAAIAIALAIGGACIANADIKQRDKLAAPDGAANDQFGTAVAVDGHTLVVAAPGKQVGSNAGQGALYVYSDEDTGSWEKVATLTAKTGDAGDAMGSSTYGSGVAISGNTIVASTFGRTTSGDPKCGAYVFTRKGSNPSDWAKASQAQLQASDAGSLNFHCSVGPVAISGDNLALAGRHSGSLDGAVYVFKRSNQGDWTQKQRLVEGDDTCCFGLALAMDGDNFVITDENIAYVYGLQGGKFQKTATLHPPETNFSFGVSAAISGNTVAIGSVHYLPTGASEYSQAAYVYSASGHLLAKLTDPKAIENEGSNHGGSVATDGGLVIEGNPVQPAKGHTTQDSTNYTGMVDAWTKPPGGWSNSSNPIQVYADDAEPLSNLGGAVAMTSKELFAGSPRRNSQQGATYIFGVVSKVVLKVEESGSGDGAVKSDPPGINCGKMCRASFEPGAHVKLTADPKKGSKFAGWSGSGCSGNDPKCKVAMSVSRTVKAKFADKH